ncbi:hypothetical protein OPKNFCMD_2615 [Methylobacterium crusticola]|uniref:DUF4242 domain-containing protein n=1 Tax=Methylobacterium crusticola TaxID=1697972 RepID=A0ABQ4QYY5_9HYPH|nr:hypothetical protein [Methylobacterium crusticola]GJD49879.1 hypothetical protein OPKNFCMD_2615 [Methylobacterium crusticola]
MAVYHFLGAENEPDGVMSPVLYRHEISAATDSEALEMARAIGLNTADARVNVVWMVSPDRRVLWVGLGAHP